MIFLYEAGKERRKGMILQHLTWCRKEMQKAAELYYHTNTPLKVSKKEIEIPAGGVVRFDTYFNAFLVKTWKRFTTVQTILFRVLVDGSGTAALMGEGKEPLEEKTFSGKQEVIFFADLRKYSVYYLKLYATENTKVKSGTIETKEDGKTVSLALVICTYHRREAVLKNIQLLKEENENTKEAILERIYVIDNASSLTKEEIEGESQRILLIPNSNTGGAGGFTRGIKEAMRQTSLTHFILMDDDVKIELEAFYRTKAVLSYLKTEYRGNFLGGAMFRMDIPFLLYAAGEDWIDGYIQNPYRDTDLRTLEQTMRISEPIKAKQAYAGWWYCCVPRSHVEEKGYPMPFFLHCDDVEYSLRSEKAPIFFNGIAVWHETFEDKKNSVNEYYDVRNRLITNAIYLKKNSCWNVDAVLLERFAANLLRYRYRDIELILQAAEDFLKGPKWLEELDSSEYHKQLMKFGYHMFPIPEMPVEELRQDRKRILTLFRYLLPAYGKITIPVGALVSQYAGKREVTLVNRTNQTGMIVRKSWKETFFYSRKLLQKSVQIHLSYRRVMKMWRNYKNRGNQKEH